MFDFFFFRIIFFFFFFSIPVLRCWMRVRARSCLHQWAKKKPLSKKCTNNMRKGRCCAENRQESTLSPWTWKNYHYAEHLSGNYCKPLSLCGYYFFFLLFFARLFATWNRRSVQFDVCHGVFNDANLCVCACARVPPLRHSRCAKRRKKRIIIRLIVWFESALLALTLQFN